MRFAEYVTRFVRLASRYEEEITGGKTKIGFTSSVFVENAARPLGSGIVFNDETLGMKELVANAHRIEAWRKTSSYKYCVMVRVVLFSTTRSLLMQGCYVGLC